MNKEKKHVSAIWREIKLILAGYVISLVISGATAMIVPEGIASLDKAIPSH